jgi:dTDP-glucose pyrophosphorylase
MKEITMNKITLLNIVVPMAGRGSRFSDAGFTVPKPLISVGGKPMIQWVIENVRPTRPHRFTFICLAEHLITYPDVESTLKRLCPDCNIVKVESVTEGAACTVLLASEFINNDNPLMIANADQYVDLNIDEYLSTMDQAGASGLIMTFWSDHPKWSFCKMSNDGEVIEVVEKKVISNEATVGVYNFSKGCDFVRYANDMINKNLRVNNEFYVAPVYNQLIEDGAKVIISRTGREYDGMYGLGVPQDLEFFMTTNNYFNNLTKDETGTMSGSQLIEKRTKIYADFFNAKNIAGIYSLFNLDARLVDPSVDIRGRDNIVAYVSDLFKNNINLSFEIKNLFVNGDSSVIEFELGINGKFINGTDVIDWKDGRIMELRAYLEPI